MKNVLKDKSIVLLGSFAGTCLMATLAFANPALLPDHAGYPMKASKSPVNDVPTANDPGQENMYGQKALNAATKDYNEDMKTRRSGPEGANKSESQKPMGDRSQMGGQDQMAGQEHKTGQDQMTGQEHKTAQDQMTGQEHMTTQDKTTSQHQKENQNQMRGLDQIKSQSQSGKESGNSMAGQN